MKRRDFLKGNFSRMQSLYQNDFKGITADLDKYDKPLDYIHAAHLLKRLTLGPTPELLNKLNGMSVDEAVDLILGSENDPLNNASTNLNWIDIQEEDPLDGLPLDIRTEIEGKHQFRYREFLDWWLETMTEEKDLFQEKLTLFLSTIWCIEFTYDTLSMIPPPLLYRNNELLRKYRIGSYRNLAFEMTLDGAMLLYQSLNFSTANAPNENFMRELLELFTMGIGNYSEGDIREGSRTLTGWRIAANKYKPAPNGIFKTYFSPKDHDTQAKQVMGVSIPARSEFDNSEFQVKEQEVRKLINILFDERAEQISKFICEKIYRYFVYSSPGDVSDSIVSELAQTFRNNNFNLRPVYKKLFTSKHFYDSDIIGCQIKTPPEFIIGLQRALDAGYMIGHYNKSREACSELEMDLYDPPNVGSWIGYRTWISTTTYPSRVEYAREILSLTSDAQLINLVKSFNEYTELEKVIKWISILLVPVTEDSTIIEYNLNIAKNILGSNVWTEEIIQSSQIAANTIRKTIESMILIPDFNLC